MILVVKNIYVENQMVQVKVDTAIEKYLWRRKNIRRKNKYIPSGWRQKIRFMKRQKCMLCEGTKIYVLNISKYTL